MKIHSKSILSLLMIVSLIAGILSACGTDGISSSKSEPTTSGASSAASSNASGPSETATADEEVVNYTAYFDIDVVAKWFDNPNDVVTKWYEDTYKLHCTEVLWRSDQTTDQRIATFIASNSMPDIVVANRASVFSALDYGYDLTSLVEEHMPYYWNNVLDDTLRKTSTVNGQVKFIYKYEAFGVDEKSGLDDPYFNQINHTWQIREDILTKLGYKFTPMAELIETCNAEKRAPTLEDFAIDPVPYTTPEEFVEFLGKINALGLTDQAGNKVIPLSVNPSGGELLLTGFDYSIVWKWNEETKQADGWLGSPEAKDAFHFWWQLYSSPDNLLDKDYIIQKLPQLQEKISTGRVAMFDSLTDLTAANLALAEIDPSMTIRPMPLPIHENYGYTQTMTPFRAALINKDMPEEHVIRFLKMWDFMNTPEGITITCFGPPGELTEENADGKLIFKEPLMSVVKENKADLPGGPDESGVVGMPGTYMRWGDYWAKVAYISGAPRHRFGIGVERAFDPIVDVLSQGRRIMSIQKLPREANASFPRGTTANMPATYWGSFMSSDISMLLNAKSEDEFNTAWDYIMQQNETVGQYSAAQAEMTEYFKSVGYN